MIEYYTVDIVCSFLRLFFNETTVCMNAGARTK
jgi:hypothetical protein